MPLRLEDVMQETRSEAAAPQGAHLSFADVVGSPAPMKEEQEKEGDSYLSWLGKNLESGLQRSAAGMDWMAANAAMLAGRFMDYSREAQRERARIQGYEPAPSEPDVLQNAATWFEKNYRRRAGELMEMARGNASEDTLGKVVQVAGGLPLSIVQAAAASSLAGPVVGFAGMGALEAADEGVKESAKEALKGAFLGYVMKATGAYPRAVRAASVGGTAAAISEQEGVDRAIDAATMATLAAIPGTPAAREAKVTAKPLERMPETRAERVEPREEIAKPAPIPVVAKPETTNVPALAGPPKEAAAAERPITRPRAKPVIDTLKKQGGIHPDSPVAEELKGMGITSKTAPGLFRRSEGALRDVDAIPLSEVPEFWGRGLQEGYVPRQTVLDALDAEMRNKPWLTEEEYGLPAQEVPEGWESMQIPELRPAEEVFFNRPTASAISPGQEYRPFVKTEYDEAAVEAGKAEPVLTRGEVLNQFVKDMGQPIYQGGMAKFPGATGYLKPETGAMRIRNRNDIESVAHEMGHEIGARYPEVATALEGNMLVRSEMEQLGYEGGNVEEGWADFNRLWLTQPQEAAAAAPATSEFFSQMMEAHPELKTAYTRAQDGMTRWLAQDALRRAESKMTPEQQLNDMFESRADEFRQAWLDDTRGSERFEEYMSGGKLREAAESPTKSMRMLRGSRDIVSGTLKYGAPKVAEGGVRYEGEERGLIPYVYRHATSKGGNLKDFFQYMVGRRAKELKAEGRENLLSDDEIEAMLALERPEYKEAAERYQELNGGFTQFAVDNGVLSQEARDTWLERFYVPFFRETQRGRAGPRGMRPGVGRVARRLRGGTANLRDINENILSNMQHIVDLSLQNEVIGQWVKLAKEPGGGRFLEKIPKDDARVTILSRDAKEAFRERYKEGETQRVEQTLKDHGMTEEEIASTVDGWLRDNEAEMDANIDRIWENVKGPMQMWQRGLEPRRDNVIVHLVDGKPEYYEVLDPLLWRTALAFHRPYTSNPLIRALHVPKRLATWTITHSIPFWGGNIAKDQTMSWSMNRYGFRPFVEGAKGLRIRMSDWDRYRQATRGVARGLEKAGAKHTGKWLSDLIDNDLQTYLDWKASGGGMAGIYEAETIRGLGEPVRAQFKTEGVNRTILDTGLKYRRAFDAIFEASETATRLGLFSRARQSGASPREAAYESRHIIDYAQRGDLEALNLFVDTVPFLRAGLTGLDRFAEGAWRDKGMRKQLWYRVGALSLLSAAIAASNYGNPLFEKEDDVERDMYVNIIVPTAETIHRMANGTLTPSRDQLARTMEIGSPQEAQAAWEEIKRRYHHWRYPKPFEVGSIMSMAEHAVRAMIDDQPTEEAKRALISVLRNFHITPVPAAVRPAVESFANVDLFTGRPITREEMKQIDPRFRYEDWTPRTIRALGEKTGKVGISPIELEHWIRSFFNAWGSGGMYLAEQGLYEDATDMDPYQKPLVRRFTRSPASGTRYRGNLRDMLDEAASVQATAKFLIKNREEEKALQYMTEHPEAGFTVSTRGAVSSAKAKALDRIVDVQRDIWKLQRFVNQSSDIKELHDVAESLLLGEKQTGKLKLWKAGDAWRDPGKLKRLLLNELQERKNLEAMRALIAIKSQMQGETQ